MDWQCRWFSNIQLPQHVMNVGDLQSEPQHAMNVRSLQSEPQHAMNARDLQSEPQHAVNVADLQSEMQTAMLSRERGAVTFQRLSLPPPPPSSLSIITRIALRLFRGNTHTPALRNFEVPK
ncbi:hypothetical protein CEXT_184211 [Caerostris extrusa]|uniref:Uncharacterized protein n=1 Tax=Caerostris extrusa TaxID=172846 RepID=A0AAV4S0H3_CAEEX|nr:hypothetical protein CEXT_184211 [Caerostris extrusa]